MSYKRIRVTLTTVMSADEAKTLNSQNDRDGYAVARGVFSKDEASSLIEHFMTLRAAGSYEGDFAGRGTKTDDPLFKFPRMLNMHRWDATTKNWMLDQRIIQRLQLLLGIEAYAVQSMIYFKPAGA